MLHIYQIADIWLNLKEQTLGNPYELTSRTSSRELVGSPIHYFGDSKYLVQEREISLSGYIINNDLQNGSDTLSRLNSIIGMPTNIIGYLMQSDFTVNPDGSRRAPCENMIWVENRCVIKSITPTQPSYTDFVNISIKLSLFTDWSPLNNQLWKFGNTFLDRSFYYDVTNRSIEMYEFFTDVMGGNSNSIFYGHEVYDYSNNVFQFPKCDIFEEDIYQGFQRVITTDAAFNQKDARAYITFNHLLWIPNVFYGEESEMNNHWFYHEQKAGDPTSFEKTIYVNRNIWNGLPATVFKLKGMENCTTGLIRITNRFINESGNQETYHTEFDIAKINYRIGEYDSAISPSYPVPVETYLVAGNFKVLDVDNFVGPDKRTYAITTFGREYIDNFNYEDYRISYEPRARDIIFDGIYPFPIFPGDNFLNFEFIGLDGDVEIFYNIVPKRM